jgi:hypothetical protein
MNYHELGIPDGSKLIFRDGNATVEVVSEWKVKYEGVESSLVAVTRKLLGLREDYALQPSPFWTFNGRTVKSIYDEVHNADGE